jgi:hypothetical protein
VKVVPGLGAHDRGVPAEGARPGGGVAPAGRDVGVDAHPRWRTGLVRVDMTAKTLTIHVPRVRLGVPDHIGQGLAQRGQRVIAEFHGNGAVQRTDQRDLALEPSTRRTTGEETPPMSSDFDPLQAWPKPVQTPYPPNGRR